MADKQKIRFLRPRGFGAVRFATGCVADVPAVWASRFLKDGSAELVADKPKAEKIDKPKGKGK